MTDVSERRSFSGKEGVSWCKKWERMRVDETQFSRLVPMFFWREEHR
jgi:hypothetical protein